MEFLGGKPTEVPEHYHEADPMQLSRRPRYDAMADSRALQTMSSLATSAASMPSKRRSRGEDVHYLEIATAGHFDLIDPHSNAWPKVENTVATSPAG